MLHCCLCTDTATHLGRHQGISLKAVGLGAASPRGKEGLEQGRVELGIRLSARVRGQMDLTAR